MSNTHGSNRLAGSAVRIGVTCVLWLSLFAANMMVVPMQKKVFDQYGLKLPSITMIVFDISMFANDYWWLAFPFVPPLLAVIVLITFKLRHRRTWYALWTAFLLVPPLVCHILFWISMLLPRLKLAEGLRG